MVTFVRSSRSGRNGRKADAVTKLRKDEMVWASKPEPFDHARNLGRVLNRSEWDAYEDATRRDLVDRWEQAESSYIDDGEVQVREYRWYVQFGVVLWIGTSF